LPLAIAYLLAGRISPVTRVLLGYCALVMLAGITVTFSRGGWVACAAALLVLLGILISNRQHRVPAVFLLVALLGGGIFCVKHLQYNPTYVQRVSRVLDSRSMLTEPLDMRRDLWIAAVQMWRDHFWWGAGPGHFNQRFPAYRPGCIQMQPDHVHNDYLDMLADWGTAGGIITVAGMALFGAGLWQTRRNVRRAENEFKSARSNRFAFFLGASAGLLALAVHSFVDFNLHIPANAILGVVFLALLTSNLRFATERYWWNVRLPLKLVMTGALTAGLVYLGGQEIRRAQETFWLARAGQLPLFSTERTAAFEKAFAAEPQNFETAYAIGECYRLQSFEGAKNYEPLTQTAMGWYSRGMKLDPYDGYNYLGYGLCLDWLERHDEAGTWFDRADALDPNDYFIAANTGWHYVQAGDYAAARPWLQRSLKLQWSDNQIARSYLDRVEQTLRDNAAGKNNLPPGF
jgi:tetratricopeptide (TPR) repeat protein